MKTYRRQIWNYKLADFDKFRELLSDYNLIAKVEETTDLDINAQQVTDALFFFFFFCFFFLLLFLQQNSLFLSKL